MEATVNLLFVKFTEILARTLGPDRMSSEAALLFLEELSDHVAALIDALREQIATTEKR